MNTNQDYFAVMGTPEMIAELKGFMDILNRNRTDQLKDLTNEFKGCYGADLINAFHLRRLNGNWHRGVEA